jgi:hypothetical protein
MRVSFPAFLIDVDPRSAGQGRLLENCDARSVDETAGSTSVRQRPAG